MTPEGYKKHKHLIEQWANGAKIQCPYPTTHSKWITIPEPSWDEVVLYRIKPPSPVFAVALYWNIDKSRKFLTVFEGDKQIKAAEKQASFIRWVTPATQYEVD